MAFLQSFERFCQTLLEKLYPEATVHAVGGLGHSQEGADIEVAFPDGTRHSFQCKRVDQFGPAKIEKAVAEHTKQATKKIIVLARVASPKARDAVQMHCGWDIWDKEDISRRVRQLSIEQQVQLVNTFFPQQRFPLLGKTADGRWQVPSQDWLKFEGGVISSLSKQTRIGVSAPTEITPWRRTDDKNHV